MGSSAKPYADTTVSPEKSMGEAMELLAKRKATGMQWTVEGATTTLRFRWRSTDGTELCARFRVEVKPPRPPLGKRFTSAALDVLLLKERRRLMRVLVYFIKNMFEAVDGGLLTLEQALLPYLEDATGHTVGELLAPRLKALAAGPLARALGASAHPVREGEDR